MPKRIAAQVRWDDARAAYVVWNGGTPVVPEILLGSTGWAAWLERTSSFAFQPANGAACTVRKEMVQRGGAYWYAYRRVGERMAKRYLGRAADLTAARLEEANGGLRESQGEHVGRDESNQVAQNQ